MPRPPPDPLLDPNTPCHWGPGTEPAFFISSHLLWQPCVCLVFTSRDAWRLSLLDHTRGASQCFPSSADIFLMMPLPLYPFSWSSPRRCSCGPCPASGPDRRLLLAPLATASPSASLGNPTGLPMPGTISWHVAQGGHRTRGTFPCSPWGGFLGCWAGYCSFGVAENCPCEVSDRKDKPGQ